jgi:hypothetical protein
MLIERSACYLIRRKRSFITVLRNPLLVPVLSQLNPVHTLQNNFPKIRLNIILGIYT